MGRENKNVAHIQPLGPTDALPGTEAKIKVMAARLSRGLDPHHPDDAKWDDAAIERVLIAMKEWRDDE